MNLAKFLALLETSGLFFARVDVLGSTDPFEGYYTAANMLIDQVSYEDMTPDWLESNKLQDPETFAKYIASHKQIRELGKEMRTVTFANCWHVQDYESAAMWTLYDGSHQGIAVRSTYQRLTESLSSYSDFEVHAGMVNYIDYDSEPIPFNNLLAPFMYKRRSFEHEKELRALIWTPQFGKNSSNPSENKFKDAAGLLVPVDLPTLVEQIVVSPTSPDWYIDLVKALVQRIRPKLDVAASSLSLGPPY